MSSIPIFVAALTALCTTFTLPSSAQAQDPLLLTDVFGSSASVTAGCPTFGNRLVYHALNEEDLSDARSTLESNGFRAVSLSAATDPETGAPVFDLIGLSDALAQPAGWGFSVGLSGSDVTSTLALLPGRPVSIDAYLGDNNARLYAITWVDDGVLSEMSIGVTLGQLRDDDATHQGNGLRPIWIDGFNNGENTRFSAIWVDDGIEREMDLSRLDADAADAAWKARTDEGQRMLRMTEFQFPGDDGTNEIRKMSVWQTDTATCAGAPWAAFSEDSARTYQATLVAQNVRSRRHFIEDREIEVDLDDLPGLIALGHLTDDDGTDLTRISTLGTPADGTLMVLRLLAGGDEVVVSDVHLPTFEPENPPEDLEDLLDGNIRLRRWNVGGDVSNADVDNDDACRFNALLSGCQGQGMRLNKFHNRIALAWDAEDETWNEVKREGFLPDRYAPIATDAQFVDGERLVSSTWAGRDLRVPTSSTLTPEGGASVADQALHTALPNFDAPILAHMRGRRIPHATFAVALDGRVVTARHYALLPQAFLSGLSVSPDTRFHIASISKPVTALAIMRLVETEGLDLDMPITDIPGVSDLIGTGWQNTDMSTVTTRMLLYHMGGWDRTIDDEISIGRDYEICDLTGVGLPVNFDGMMQLAHDEPVAWAPGTRQEYSNFGYTVLGRIIEAVSGQAYDAYVLNEVLPPDVAAQFEMSRTTLFEDQPPDLIQGYDVRNPTVWSVMGIPVGGTHPLREACNANHADRELHTSGLFNTGLTDAHGGWIADALATARLFSQTTDLMEADSFQEMVSLPTGRETRVVQQVAGAPNLDHTYQLVRARHPMGSLGIDLATIPTGDRLFVGLGFNTFSGVEIELATAAAAGDEVAISASYSVDGTSFDSLDITDDGTEGLTQDGTIRFDPPPDWVAQARNGETQPRFWVALEFGETTGTTPVFDRVRTSGHITRAMAFVASPQVWTMDVTDLVSLPALPFFVVGAQSQASARVIATASTPDGAEFTLDRKREGSFQPGEALGLFGPNDPAFAEIARVGDDRERPSIVDIEHGGSLPGVDTLAKRRSSGVSWALFFAQGASSTPFYIARGGNLLEDAIDDLIDTVPMAGWPGWDIDPE